MCPQPAASSAARVALRALYVLLWSALLLAGHPHAGTASAILVAPTSLSVSGYPTPTSVRLFWTSNSTAESSFGVERKVDGQADTAFTPIGSAGPVNHSGASVFFTDSTGLDLDTAYDYRVRAIAADGTPSAYSNTAIATTAPVKPINVAVASVAGSGSRLTLTWTDNARHTTYFQLWRKGPGQATFSNFRSIFGNPGKGVASSYTDNGLTDSTSYSYYVVAYNGASSDPSDTVTGTTLTPLTTPAAPSVYAYGGPTGGAGTPDPKTTIDAYVIDNSTNSTSVTLQRLNADDPAGVYATLPGYPQAGPGTNSGYLIADTGLALDTAFSYRGFASNSKGDSPFSNVVTVSTAPVKPINVVVASVAGSGSRLTLTWTDNARHTSYFQLWRRGPGQATFTNFTNWGSYYGGGTPGKGVGFSYNDNGLTDSTSYSYYVVAYSGAGSDPSDTVTGTTLTTLTPPAVPSVGTSGGSTGADGKADPRTTILAYITDQSTNGTSVTLQRLNADDPAGAYATLPGYPKADTGGNGTFYYNYDTGLAVDTAYSYRGFASNSKGDSPFSNAATAYTAPAKPISVQATPLSDTKIKLTWTDNARHTSYFQLWRKGPGQTTFTNFTNFTGFPGKGVGFSYTDTGLTVGGTYSYYVVAFKQAASDPSDTVTATTFPTNPPGAPTDLQAAGAAKPSQVNLNWLDNSTTEYGFIVERMAETETVFSALPGTNPGDPTVGAQPGTARVYYSDTKVTDDTAYAYRVKATNPAGDSAYSNTISATTAPTAPTTLTAAAVARTSDRITLTWTSSSRHEAGFYIYRRDPGKSAFANVAFVAAAAGPGSTVTYTGLGLSASTTYSFYVTAYNGAGESAPSNTASATTAAIIPTTMTITSPADGAMFNVGDSIPVTVTATPAVGTTIVSYTLIVNGVPATQAAGSFTLAGLAAGSYTLKANALDSAGNTAVFPGLTITVVSQPPGIANAALTPATLPASGGTLTVSATVTDPNGAGLSGVSATLLLNGVAVTSITLSGGGAGSLYTGTYSVPANTSGASRVYTAQVQAQNAAGLGTTVTAAGSCTESNGNPVPVLTSLSPTSALVGTTGLTLTVSGSGFIAASTVSFGTFTGLVPAAGTLTATQFQVAIPNGALANAGPVSVTVTNPVPLGGTSGALSFAVVLPAPVAPVLQSATAGDGQVSLTFTTVANAATYALKSAAKSGGPYTTDRTGITAAAGAATVTASDANQMNGIQKYFVVSAVGSGGESPNSNELGATPRHINLPPTVTLTSPANGTTLTAPAALTLSATASDPDGTVAQVEFFQKGVSVGVVKAAPYTVPVTGLTTGVYTFKAVATDNSGATAASATATVTVVNPALGVTILSGPADQSTVCTGTVVFTWVGYSSTTPAAQLRYEYQIDNSGTWSAPIPDTTYTLSGLAAGLHSFAVRLLNADGSSVGTPVGRSFFVNLTPPTLLTASADARDTRAVVSWSTSKPTTGQIEFGTTTSYGQMAPANDTLDGAHRTTLAGLTTQTVYHYRIHFTDGCHAVVSDDQTFTTQALLKPNLSVIGATVPGSFAPLDRINLSWTVLDSGPGDALGDWTDSVYLSTGPVLDVTAVKLGDFAVSGPVLAFGSYTHAGSMAVPRVPAGKYYLIIQANSTNVLPETTTADNTLAAPIEVTALQDLVVTPDQTRITLKVAKPVSGTLTLTDLSLGTISGITATVQGGPASVTVQVTPPDSLQSLESKSVPYTVTAADASVLSGAAQIVFTSASGVKATATLNLTVIPPTPRLVAAPMTLKTSMVRGGQRLVDFTVTNTGDAVAKNLTLKLPNFPWMSATTLNLQGDLGPGATGTFELALTPGTALPLGLYSGTIVAGGDNAGLSIPFAFNCISINTGGLKVVAQDEFSFFADTHPNVAGAHFVMTDSTTGAVVVDDVTGPDGSLTETAVLEGNYNVDVTADGHNAYHGQRAVVAGEMNEIDPFLSRQLVTYTWTVVPVPFTDTYTVVLEATFETHVPAPVVTVSPVQLDLSTLSYDAAGKAVVNYTLTNHGLIAANDTQFNITGQSDYTVTPALTSLGTIAALSSVIVPVTIVRKAAPVPSSRGAVSGHGRPKPNGLTDCISQSLQGITRWSYLCGGPQTAGGAFILFVGGNLAISGCGLLSLFSIFGGGGDVSTGGGPGPSGPGGGDPPPIETNGPCGRAQ